jgi:hypothetical protein
MLAKRVDGLRIERTEGELLVLRQSTQEAHALNQTAAIVFDLCDGATTRVAMAAEVARRTGLPTEVSIVDLALNELVEAGLVELDEGACPEITRRSLIRRLALPVAAVAMLPVVETVLMPTVSSGQPVTPPPPGPPTVVTFQP